MGEFGVIELLNEMIVEQRAQADSDGASGFRLLVDTGDDAAAWKVGDTTELLTTDTMVEGCTLRGIRRRGGTWDGRRWRRT